jgi:hypothetical protein
LIRGPNVLRGDVSPQFDELGGVYCENVEIAEIVTVEDGFNISDTTDQKGVQAYAVDPESATPPWDLSEKMQGRTFDV